VIKVGSSILCQADKSNLCHFYNLAFQVAKAVVEQKKNIIIVSSGAIALGSHALGIKGRPKEVSMLQASAAVGQKLLMDNYSLAFRQAVRQFGDYALHCGQILLTWDDFTHRKRYLNAKNTLLTLFKLGVIPIINENDTIATEEIRFGDNDRLSALVATMVNAELLIILSDVEGLCDKQKKVIRVIADITSQIRRLASPTDKVSCVGGMVTKIEAAKIAVESGIPCVIADGRQPQIINSLIDDPTSYGTLFVPKNSLTERQRWIAFGAKTKGSIVIDDGAVEAIKGKKSLLCVGVVAVKGNFEAGEIVSIEAKDGSEIARGKAGISGRQLDKIKGSRFEKEIVHRDNIVVLNPR